MVALDADGFLVPVSPSLVWRVGLPGAPDCCHEHACQTRQFSEAPRATTLSITFWEVSWRRSSSAPARWMSTRRR